jgi:hypothetical protein
MRLDAEIIYLFIYLKNRRLFFFSRAPHHSLALANPLGHEAGRRNGEEGGIRFCGSRLAISVLQ